MAFFGKMWDNITNFFRKLFWKQEMELTMVGLQNSGKTTLTNVLAAGNQGVSDDLIPTIGFNMRKVSKGNTTIKVWDIGGQPRFRSMWERYCRGVSVIVYVVDAADLELLPTSKAELHELLRRPSLQGIPLLVLGNKNDLPDAIDVEKIIEVFDMQSIRGREVACYSISAKNQVNIDKVIEWLVAHAKDAKKKQQS